ncbi:cytochrome C assembly protein [Neobacillus piezotolerans]|uniref:Heme exporter protein C n=1 Tax=Neobacillus piezotolerans TaxID=2259171 RepID=A0A3D8GM70_9BACI|nr:cytochrome c biogenesis protein [Neobacillus piezotolerans]RDU35156.1 cytochrome C assembly protein [Neobacillus piezotolerans]
MSVNIEKQHQPLAKPGAAAIGKPVMPKILFGATVVSVLAAIYLIFMYAKIEVTMGAVQKIFYIHVASAWTGFLAFFVTFVSSILYLFKRKRIFDTYAFVSAEIGVVFTTIVLTTGPIWAKSSWNTWWAWEPRLTTTLVLWFIYMAYIMIHQMDGVWEKKARLAAVFGIIGFADVPIVWFAIRWWNSKFHPIVFGEGPSQKGGGIDDTMLVALLATITALTFFYTYLLNKGVTLENMKIKVSNYKEKIRESIEN